ncbi:hypothetical protein RUND412_006454 [Rhizina undulata]
MDPSVEWSRYLSDVYLALTHGDPQGDLRKFRHMIPQFVLRAFCNNNTQNGYVFCDQNQMPTWVGESETLIIYKPETKEFEKRHWTECFGAENIYSAYFDNLTTNIVMREGFRKFNVLKNVDREIFTGMINPIWQINQQQNAGIIPLRRSDVDTLRKYLFLHMSLQSRDRYMHLMAHAPEMEEARARRRVHIETHGMEHPRDVWLQNAEKIIETPHHDVVNNEDIFDLDREDYRANARERYIVFWEAQPGDEFIVTENAFGGFEGGQIGDKPKSQVNMSGQELERHIYTRDFMWHQLYVISPTLVIALCHGSLMNPELTRLQRKRFGLRRSLLESLPHQPAPKYYKDMAKNEASFLKPGWTLPPDVEKAFGGVEAKSIAHDRRREDELMFPVMPLKSSQVAMVNSVLLHHQQQGKKVKTVCYKSPPSYTSLHQSLDQFQRTPWNKYSQEKQNDYSPLNERLVSFLNPTPPPEPIGGLYGQPMQYGYPLHSQMPIAGPPAMMDPRKAYGERRRSITPSDIPGFSLEPFNIDLSAHSRPHSHTTQSSHSLMSHHSLTSSLTPSSQSSQYSSASSQSSVSTKTTSIDTPRFEVKELSNDRRYKESPTRKPEPQPPVQRNVSQTHPEPPRSDESGKPRRVEKNKSEKPSPQKPSDHMLERAPQVETRGRQPDLVKSQPPAPAQSKASKPRPDRSELPPPQPQPAPSVQRSSSAMPERPNFLVEADRPRPSEKPQAEPQQARAQRTGSVSRRQSVVIDNPMPRQHEPERSEQPQPQPPTIVNMRQSSPQLAQPQPQSTNSHDTVRGRSYEIVPADRSSNASSGTERSSQSEDSTRGRQYETIRVEPPEARRASISVERSSHGSDKVRRQQYHTVSNFPSSQYTNNTSSGERVRNGVEIIRARQSSEPTKIEQPRPVNANPRPTSTYLEVVENATKVSELPVIKQLRFDARTLIHKHSDMSLAGSMVVETGDIVEDADDEESWVDEGFAESVELMKPRKPTVRFADRPLSRTGGRGIHIERPSSRLGRKAEIQQPSAKLGRRAVQIERPLSRNGQRFEVASARKSMGAATTTPAAATNRNRIPGVPHAQQRAI